MDKKVEKPDGLTGKETTDMRSDLPDIDETPYLLVDVEKFEQNLSRMAHDVRELGVSLRPHIKTHKIPRIARRQVELGATGITVAKLAEAEVMAVAGIDDIFVAHPIVVIHKIKRALQLNKRVRLAVGVDSLDGAKRLSEVAARGNQTLNVRLEVDTGLRRSGVQFGAAPELARRIAGLEGINLTGIYTYRGAFVDGAATLDFERAGRDEGEVMSQLTERIRRQGVQVKAVSVGSTPTARSAGTGRRVTEVRPGTYVFNDRMQATLGICALEDCAAAVIATVASRPSESLAVIDAGSKSFATDVQPGKEPLDMKGFGHVIGRSGVTLDRLWEEHGTLVVDGNNDDLRVGDRVRVIPNHICSTVNLYNTVYFQYASGECEEVNIEARGLLI